MKALILGAGYGVRLYPLTKDLPKPLLPIAGKPVVEWTMERLKSIKEIDGYYLVVNARFHEHYQRWLTDYKSPRPITLVNDGSTDPDNRLGAVKDILFTIEQEKINDDLLVIAGDNLFDFALTPIIRCFKGHGPTVALINLKGMKKEFLSQYAITTLDKNKRIIEFEEKPPIPKGTLAAVCLYIFPRAELPLITEYLKCCYNPDAPGYYIQWLYKRTNLYGCEMKGQWFDIGDIDSYSKAQEHYLRKVKVTN